MKYDYKQEMTNDLQNYISDYSYLFNDASSNDDLEQKLNDALWIEDAITGNASGSYYCNAYKAMEAVEGNEDLLKNALYDFGCDDASIGNHFLNGDYEYFDVTIRCYLLSEVVGNFVSDLEFQIGSEVFDCLEDAREYIEDNELQNAVITVKYYDEKLLEVMDVCKRYNVQPINNPDTRMLYINVSVEA